MEELGLAVGMCPIKLFVTPRKKTLKIIKQHEMDAILIKKNLGDARTLAVCAFLLGLPGTDTLVSHETASHYFFFSHKSYPIHIIPGHQESSLS